MCSYNFIISADIFAVILLAVTLPAFKPKGIQLQSNSVQYHLFSWKLRYIGDLYSKQNYNHIDDHVFAAIKGKEVFPKLCLF